MTEAKPIGVLLAEVSAEVGVVPRGHTMRSGGESYAYRSVDQIQAAAHPHLAARGIVILPAVLAVEREEREARSGARLHVCHLTVQFSFRGPAGDEAVAVTQGEAQDSGDKATGKAMTAAFKAALSLVLNVPSVETARSDPDHQPSQPPEDRGGQARPGRSAQRRPSNQPRAEAPPPGVDPDTGEIRATVHALDRELAMPELAAALGLDNPWHLVSRLQKYDADQFARFSRGVLYKAEGELLGRINAAVRAQPETYRTGRRPA